MRQEPPGPAGFGCGNGAARAQLPIVAMMMAAAMVCDFIFQRLQPQ
jgi:hypothetical protein